MFIEVSNKLAGCVAQSPAQPTGRMARGAEQTYLCQLRSPAHIQDVSVYTYGPSETPVKPVMWEGERHYACTAFKNPSVEVSQLWVRKAVRETLFPGSADS